LSPSPPPALPPKKHNSSNLNKRLSISTVCLSSAKSGPHHSESDCLTDGSVAERIKNFMSKANQKGQNTNKNDSTEIKPLMRVRPRSNGRSMQDLSSINNNTEEPAYVTPTLIGKIVPKLQGGVPVDSETSTPKATTKVLTPKATTTKTNSVVIEDLPKKLPSVRNLASIFTSTKKSPEPLPRRSLIKQKPQPEKKVETTVSNAVVVLEKNKVNDYNQQLSVRLSSSGNIVRGLHPFDEIRHA